MSTYLKPALLLVLLLVALPALAAKEDKKGHGAGGVRSDHVSEQGEAHGKAWAGSKEAAPEEEEAEKSGKPKKEKKEKKEKKAKKER